MRILNVNCHKYNNVYCVVLAYWGGEGGGYEYLQRNKYLLLGNLLDACCNCASCVVRNPSLFMPQDRERTEEKGVMQLRWSGNPRLLKKIIIRLLGLR